MANENKVGRRGFIKQAAGAIGASTQLGRWPDLTGSADRNGVTRGTPDVSYPRRFSGRQLKMIAFPLGGVAAGSLSLGGRGQLRDWEIFNRPDKGFSPPYALPTIWIQSGNAKPIARVLEAQILPPYEGQDGLGSNNSPGLSRVKTAEFTAPSPLAHLQYKTPGLPARI